MSGRPQRSRGGGGRSGHGEARAAGSPRSSGGASALRRGGRTRGERCGAAGPGAAGPAPCGPVGRMLVPAAPRGGPVAVAPMGSPARGAEGPPLFVLMLLKKKKKKKAKSVSFHGASTGGGFFFSKPVWKCLWEKPGSCSRSDMLVSVSSQNLGVLLGDLQG